MQLFSKIPHIFFALLEGMISRVLNIYVSNMAAVTVASQRAPPETL